MCCVVVTRCVRQGSECGFHAVGEKKTGAQEHPSQATYACVFSGRVLEGPLCCLVGTHGVRLVEILLTAQGVYFAAQPPPNFVWQAAFPKQCCGELEPGRYFGQALPLVQNPCFEQEQLWVHVDMRAR